ncbi:MAG: radical SAM protein [Geobacteraceae bacterium]|nr:radical SAM protein [Geobacteraceae bacterium]
MKQSTTIEISDFPLWATMKEHHRLLSFDLEITARCNNDCRHCYINLPAGDRLARSRELTPQEIGDIADQAVELGAVWVLISGGEPLLREDFSEIYLLLKRKGLLVSVFTNATLVREEHIALFRKYPPRDIEITVYGATEETYERVTGRPGSFAAFTAGLNRLLECGIRVRLKAMAIRSNFHELPTIADFSHARTKDFFRFDHQLHLRFDRDEERNLMIRAERLTPEEVVALEKADESRFASLQKNCAILIKEDFPHIVCDHLFHCGLGVGSFNVGYDGTFRLCSSLWAPGTVYDLRQGTLREAWEEFVPQVRDMRSRRPEYLENCRSCPIINLCLWCPAHADLETGEIDSPVEYFCQVARARAAAIQGKSQET